MSPFVRRVILAVGIILLVCGFLALSYALWPLGAASIQEILAATQFAPP